MRFFFIPTFVAALARLCCAAQPAELIPVPLGKEAPKIYGYIDRSGAVKIPATFLRAELFSENLAAFHNVDDDVGYIDPAGKIVVKPQFVDGGPFTEGMAAVRVDDPKSPSKNPYGFIDTTGKLVITANLRSASPFSNGFAYVVSEENKPEFLDKTGKVLQLPEGCRPQASFSDGLALVRNGSRCGFVDTTGKLVIDLRDGLIFGEEVSSFSEGLAPFSQTATVEPGVARGRATRSRRIMGYMDKIGKTAVEPQYLEARPFSEGLASVMTAPDHFAYIDKTGKTVIDLNLEELHEAGEFHDGRAQVLVGGTPYNGAGGKHGYIDKTGKLVIPANYFAATDFHNGLATVSTKTRSLLIDPAGAIVWPKE